MDGPDAIHRLKLLAGTRWTPGRPGRMETETEGNEGYNAGDKQIGREGWVKISEARFQEPKMNRKSASDMLERLVEAANVSFLPFLRKQTLILQLLCRTRNPLCR